MSKIWLFVLRDIFLGTHTGQPVWNSIWIQPWKKALVQTSKQYSNCIVMRKYIITCVIQCFEFKYIFLWDASYVNCLRYDIHSMSVVRAMTCILCQLFTLFQTPSFQCSEIRPWRKNSYIAINFHGRVVIRVKALQLIWVGKLQVYISHGGLWVANKQRVD